MGVRSLNLPIFMRVKHLLWGELGGCWLVHALLCYVGWCSGYLCVWLCDMRVAGGKCSISVNINHKSGEMFCLSICFFSSFLYIYMLYSNFRIVWFGHP